MGRIFDTLTHRKMAAKKKGHCLRIIMAALLVFNGLEGAVLRFSAPIAHASLSVEKEKEMGRRLVLQIERELEIIRNPIVQQYVERIGERFVAQIGQTPYEFRYYVVKSPDPNAFAIPGGHIFLASGLIIMASSEDEVAGVVGHEIAHIKARHIAQRIERAQRLSLVTLAGILAGVIAGGKAAGAVMTSTAAAAQALALKYSREDEREADQLGFEYLMKTGYGGWGMVSFLRKLHRMSLLSPGSPPSYLSTHPGIEERISYLIGRLRDFPPATPGGNGADLKRVQAFLFVEEREAESAIRHFQSMLQGKPTDVDALFGLALAYKKTGRVDLAIGELERARQLSAEDGGILRELGICYFLNRRLDDAISVLRKSLAIDLRDVLSLYYMGRAFQEKGDLEASLDAYSKAKEINPEFLDVYYSLAMVYGKRADRCNSHRHFGTYFSKKGEVKEALIHLRKALEYCDKKEAIQEEIRGLERVVKEQKEEL